MNTTAQALAVRREDNAIAQVVERAVELPQLSADQIVAQAALIQKVLRSVMIKDVHYGVIPGTGTKPVLLKAGSEKVLQTFRIAPEPQVEDLSTDDCIRYRVLCVGRHISSDLVVGYGIGECSTDEEKYKWKRAVTAQQWKDTPEDQRRIAYKKGWNNKPDTTIQQIRTNPADLANTVLKMAKKRSQIDLTLTATAASDVFDQDLDELVGVMDIQEQGQAARGGQHAGPRPDQGPAPAATGDATSQSVTEAIEAMKSPADANAVIESMRSWDIDKRTPFMKRIREKTQTFK